MHRIQAAERLMSPTSTAFKTCSTFYRVFCVKHPWLYGVRQEKSQQTRSWEFWTRPRVAAPLFNTHKKTWKKWTGENVYREQWGCRSSLGIQDWCPAYWKENPRKPLPSTEWCNLGTGFELREIVAFPLCACTGYLSSHQQTNEMHIWKIGELLISANTEIGMEKVILRLGKSLTVREWCKIDERIQECFDQTYSPLYGTRWLTSLSSPRQTS